MIEPTLIVPGSKAEDHPNRSWVIASPVTGMVVDRASCCIEVIFGSSSITLDRAVELMFCCAGRQVVTGMGKSGLIARKIAATLNSKGSPALYLHPVEALHGDLGMVVRGDVVLALSASGETEEMLALLATIKRLQVPLISMTGDAMCEGLTPNQGEKPHFSRKRRASLATVVVLPEPCKPASRMTAGGVVARSSPAAAPPISAASSRCTMLMSACPGVNDPATSSPSALSRTAAMKSLTTGSATSASSSARRTSRNASWIFDSVRRASPRNCLTTRPRRSVRLSNMGNAKLEEDEGGDGAAARFER